jgi:hypothetical protein
MDMALTNLLARTRLKILVYYFMKHPVETEGNRELKEGRSWKQINPIEERKLKFRTK